jgi:hypothetical protein
MWKYLILILVLAVFAVEYASIEPFRGGHGYGGGDGYGGHGYGGHNNHGGGYGARSYGGGSGGGWGWGWGIPIWYLYDTYPETVYYSRPFFY